MDENMVAQCLETNPDNMAHKVRSQEGALVHNISSAVFLPFVTLLFIIYPLQSPYGLLLLLYQVRASELRTVKTILIYFLITFNFVDDSL